MVNIVHQDENNNIIITSFVDGQIHPKFDQQQAVTMLYDTEQVTGDYQVIKADIGLPKSTFVFQSPLSVIPIEIPTPLLNGEIDPDFNVFEIAKNMKSGGEPSIPENYVLVGCHVEKEKSVIVWQKPLQTKVFEIETPIYDAPYHVQELMDRGVLKQNYMLCGYDVELPQDATFRNAWEWDSVHNCVCINLDKAKEIKLGALNQEKRERLGELKGDILLALSLEDENKRITASNEYKRIDAVDIQALVDAIESVDGLIGLSL